MTKTLFATKTHMGEAYINGVRHAVTHLKLYPMKVSAIKSVEKDGYQAIQVSLSSKLKREIPYLNEVKVGDNLNPLEYLQTGSIVSVQGITKGKGFAGVVKRWGFGGGSKTHGQSDRHRAPGSIGQGTTPGRVRKGKKMAGRMGSQTMTVKNSLVVMTGDMEAWIIGPVPGHKHTLLKLTITNQQDAPKLDFITK